MQGSRAGYLYPLAVDTLGQDELDAARRVLDSGHLTMGERVKAFEADFARWVGAPHALMVNSGSSANLLVVETMLRRSRVAADWQPGDEVLVPALAWPTTVWPLLQLGLRPVFVDIEPTTLAIDLEAAASAITTRTRGMFLIHVLGRVADMSTYVTFCARHGLTLLEDACESLGGHSAGQHAGTFGRAGTFSLYFSHHISTIEGGVVVCASRELHDDLISARAHGWTRGRSDAAAWGAENPGIDPRFLFVSAGYNVRPTDLQAAIGVVQLTKLDDMILRRAQLASKVASAVRRLPWLRLAGAETINAETGRRDRQNSWMTLPFVVDEGAPLTASAVKQEFERHGVETRPIIAGNFARHPGVRRLLPESPTTFPAADAVLERGLMIGCHPTASSSAFSAVEEALLAIERLAG